MVTFQAQANPLPSNFKGTPQQLLEAILDRIELLDDKATFILSDTQPTTNVGPWFKNGKQLWVWRSDLVPPTYAPMDVSGSLTPQIAIQETPPDPATYQYWFKTDGSISYGLYHYLNLVWTPVDNSIAPGSVTTAKLANGAATTDKFVDGSVTSIKIQSPLLVSKWEGGAANQFALMDAAGTAVSWENGRLVSADLPLSVLNYQYNFSHGLSATPHRVEAYLISTQPQCGGAIPAGTLISARDFFGWRVGKTPTSVYLRTAGTIDIMYGYTRYVVIPVSIGGTASFSVRFYITP